MKIYKKVQGNKEQAIPIIIGYDTVYIHSNIKKIDKDFQGNTVDNLYEYDEIQYKKDEYIQLMANNQIKIEQMFTDLDLKLLKLELENL